MKSLYAPRKTRIIDTRTNQVVLVCDSRRYARKARQKFAKDDGVAPSRYRLESNPQVDA